MMLYRCFVQERQRLTLLQPFYNLNTIGRHESLKSRYRNQSGNPCRSGQ